MLDLVQNWVVGFIAVTLIILLYRFYIRYQKVSGRLSRIKNVASEVFGNQLITVEDVSYRRVGGEILLTNQYINEKIDFDSSTELRKR